MDNINFPAYPQNGVYSLATDTIVFNKDPELAGFTKLEKAALIIASGLLSKYNLRTSEDQQIIAQLSVELATAILNKANDPIDDDF